MTPATIAALRILALVADYRKIYGTTATRNLLEICANGAHISWAPFCTVEDCNRRRAPGRAYCKMHQMRYQRHGDPLLVRRPGRKKR